MNIERPILILAMPRSGSSMTAGIFAQHGVWTGRCRGPDPKINAKGFFENSAIKHALIRRYGKLTLARRETAFEREPDVDLDPHFRNDVESILLAEGYAGGPWLFKFSALYWPAFAAFDPIYVGVRREGVVEANLTRQEMFGTPDRERVERMVALHDAAIDETGCPVVMTDDVVAGDFSSLERAFAHCEIDFDPSIALDFVDPDLWHH